MASCPHGDEACPCPDGLACHYEGRDAFRCPTALDDEHRRYHCHVEGCAWDVGGGSCGLIKLGLRIWRTQSPDDLVAQPMWWRCGWARDIVASGTSITS